MTTYPPASRAPRFLLAVALTLALMAAGTTLVAPGRAEAAAPTITSVEPAQGPVAGGTLVTVRGSGFTDSTLVLFGGVLATSTTWLGSTSIWARTPAGAAGVADVMVVNSDGTSATLTDGFTYATTGTTSSSAVTVLGVTPSSGPASGGTVVTATGSGFQTGATVLFGLVPATDVTVASSQQLTATTPANTVATGPVAVTVVNPGGVSGSLTSAFTYGASSGPLAIGSVAPPSGSVSGGTTVTVNGTGLSSVTSVQFAGVPGTSLSVVNDTKLTVVTPPHAAGPVAVTVVSSAGSSTTLPNAFVYSSTPAVTLTGVTPATGTTAGGTSVTLTGSGFTTGMTVAVGGTTATGVVVLSSSQATATLPAHAAGVVDVTVTLPNGGTATLAGALTYTAGGTVSSPLPGVGFGLFVFTGGTNQQLFTASGCSTSTAAFWATDASGQFVVYVPGTSIAAVNAAWNAMFPTGIPANTPLIGKCA